MGFRWGAWAVALGLVCGVSTLATGRDVPAPGTVVTVTPELADLIEAASYRPERRVVAVVATPRSDARVSAQAANRSSGQDEIPSEPSAWMMLLAVFSLIGYLIGRRAMQRY